MAKETSETKKPETIYVPSTNSYMTLEEYKEYLKSLNIKQNESTNK